MVDPNTPSIEAGTISPGASCERGHGGLRSQFAKPTGLLGQAVGHLMAVKNAYMFDFAAEVLNVEHGEAILELGCGHGKLLRILAEENAAGLVVGVDHSDAMVRQASRRNDRLIRAGRVEVHEASADEMPFANARFDGVVAVNCFHIFSEPRRELAEVQRVLKPGGRLVLGLRMRHPSRKKLVAPGYTEAQVQEALALVKGCGFDPVQLQRRALAREVVCLRAERL